MQTGRGGATALGGQTVVEARRCHALGRAFITHTLQLITHRRALTWDQLDTNVNRNRDDFR